MAFFHYSFLAHFSHIPDFIETLVAKSISTRSDVVISVVTIYHSPSASLHHYCHFAYYTFGTKRVHLLFNNIRYELNTLIPRTKLGKPLEVSPLLTVLTSSAGNTIILIISLKAHSIALTRWNLFPRPSTDITPFSKCIELWKGVKGYDLGAKKKN